MILKEERDKVIAAVQANDGFMKEFIEDFLNNVPQDVQSLEEAIRQKDLSKMVRLAHSLKSVVGFFHATTSYQLAKELEGLGREGNLTAGNQKLDTLKAALEDLKELLISTL